MPIKAIADAIGTASANSVESDHGCRSRIYFDNVGDNETLTLYKVTLTSQKPCYTITSVIAAKQNEVHGFFYSDILLKNINLIYSAD